MATPLGHSIVGYVLARAAGVRSRRGMLASVGAASLPDIDFLLGYVANRDALSLHHATLTHRAFFPLLLGVGAGLVGAAAAIVRGRPPTPGDVLRPAALTTALVGSHVLMDPLPLPYQTIWPGLQTVPEVLADQAWNSVIDLAVYGGLGMLVLGRRRARHAGSPTGL